MSPFTEEYPWMTETRFMGPARVLEIEESESYIQIQMENAHDDNVVRARKAIAGPLHPGDNVLVMGENPDNLYIIGILELQTENKSSGNRIVLEGGTQAARDGQSISIYSRKKELLFEYNEKNGKTRINLESGDIEFISRNGNISFAAGKDILLNGKTVGITSRSGTVVGNLDSQGNLNSALSMKKDELSLESSAIGVTAKQGELRIDETAFTGKKITANIGLVKLVSDRLETLAQTVMSRAKNVYRTVEELCQLKTGRMRTLVKNTFHLKSKNAMLKSEEDFKVRADKIHLG
jgi:hypothetical protein